MIASYPNNIVTWVDKIDKKDKVKASDVNGAYAEIISIENQLDIRKDNIDTINTNIGDLNTDIGGLNTNIGTLDERIDVLESSGDEVILTPVSNVYTCNLSLKKDFFIDNTSTTAKSIVFSNIQPRLNTPCVTITFTSLCTITYPTGTTWVTPFTPVVGKTYYILFTSSNNGVSWSASFMQG